ncbi:NeuD/PglB/VioB family sugar acetyltransferase [Prochlorococcus sp. MIT 0801]|uniref:NeuD/PglB/VioB family sugar acetyltransferase n=1 Tax=Prochlorococcus sp. MIT 0801 TaxID=1501269 RepID=UPI0004F6037C|nr:NeuD/PglB/VioB family sugar acetyltransferase [Prochlorococcus sp. MIT 0801]AIQ98269.1 Acetyltransferase [Prochlorococcus sp. MIT 0801]
MKFKNTIIIGANNPTIIRTINDINSFSKTINVLGFIDNNFQNIGNFYHGIPILGGLNDLKYFPEDVSLINTIASKTNLRKEITNSFIEQGFNFLNVIHPSINIDSVTFGQGNIVYENSMIHPQVKIGSHNVISSCSGIAHESSIGDYNFIGPASYICGKVKICDLVYIGVGAKVLPRLTLGSDSLIAAGAVVISDIKSNSRVRGVPAKPF